MLTAWGVQHVAKFKDTTKNTVKILLAAIRLVEVGTDLVITMNVPTRIAPGTSSAATVDPALIVDGAGDVRSDVVTAADTVIEALLRSFVIVDWGLFNA